MFKQDRISQLIRFAVVGGLVAAVQSGLIWFFYSVAGFGARTSFWAGYFPAVALHFCLTKWWTFGCQRREFGQVIRYILAAAISAVVQFGIFNAALHWITGNPNIAYVIAAALGVALSYFMMRRKVFPVDVAARLKSAV
jgi:putative flippase GtrA